MSRRCALLGVAGPLWLLALVGCATPQLLPVDGELRHRLHGFALPDLERAGWSRVQIEEADVAFHKPGQGVIALRSRCGRRAPPLRASARSLWYGLEADGARPTTRTLGGRELLERVELRDGLELRTLALRLGDCALDFAQVAPPGADPSVIERWIVGVHPEPRS